MHGGGEGRSTGGMTEAQMEARGGLYSNPTTNTHQLKRNVDLMKIDKYLQGTIIQNVII